MRLLLLVLTAILAAAVAGCGSGGGNTTVKAASTGSPVIAIRTEAPSTVNVLYAVELTLVLPPGVTVSADSTSGEVAAGVLGTADATAFAGARYQPASAAGPASVRVNVVDTNGFGVGELATLTCAVSSGATVSAADFTVQNFSAKDAGAVVIPGVTPRLTFRAQ